MNFDFVPSFFQVEMKWFDRGQKMLNNNLQVQCSRIAVAAGGADSGPRSRSDGKSLRRPQQSARRSGQDCRILRNAGL